MTPVRPEATGARPVTPVAALLPAVPLADPGEEAFHRFTQFALGQQLQGRVLSYLDDGSFLVRIADATARMALPAGTRVGDALQLTLVGREPRPTFLLGAQPGGVIATLSATGRLIDSLLQAAQQHGANNAVMGKAPLMDSPAMGTLLLASVMKDALSLSGLFYESHLRAWVNGKRSLPELMREPQARAAAAPLADAAAAPHNDAANNALTQLVNQQLNTLEQNRVVWRGEAWPGQQMEWEVSDDTPEGDSGGATRSWRSEVRFELPTLGTVSATIRLTGDRLQIQIHTATQAAVHTLQRHAPRLADALNAAGSPLDSLTVSQGEPA